MPVTRQGVSCDYCPAGYRFADVGTAESRRPTDFRIEKKHGVVAVLCESCAPPKPAKKPRREVR